jgi:glucosyl-dolichyl phosphate glucuronosyltransferase
MKVSICVCTFNRAHILPYCLESLTKLTIPAGWEAEILIIDNNSTDGTRDLIAGYSGRFGIPIFYFLETQQGISAARNRAIRESRGDYLGFLDDECVVQTNWLEVAVADIDEFSPLIMGGPYAGALLPGAVPRWFKTEYGNAYFVADNYNRGYHQTFRASSGNMFLHRSVCQAQKFDEGFGPVGTKFKLGEETVLQDRYISEHPDAMVFYEPGIEVAHFVLPHKLSLSYHARRVMEAGAFTLKIKGPMLIYLLGRTIVYLCCVCPFRTAVRDRKAYPYWQNYVYERIIPRVMPIVGAALQKLSKRYQSRAA